MRSYANNYPSYNDKVKGDGEFFFNLQSQYGSEGFKVLIDGVENNVVIQEHTNTMTEDREERILLCLQNIIINQGSIIKVKWNSEQVNYENWIVTTGIDSNTIYKSMKMRKCNNFLTFKNNKGVTIKTPIILSDSNISTDGITEVDKIIVLDNLRYALVPYNNDTKELFLQQRFMFNHNAVYSITKIDDYTYFCNQNDSISNGVLKLILTSEAFVTEDDKADNLAYNANLIITPVATGNLIIQGSSSIDVGESEIYNVIYDDNTIPTGKNFTFSISNTTNATLTTIDGLHCSIKGNISSQIKLTALDMNSSTSIFKIISIQDSW